MVNGPFRYAISDVWIAVKAQALGSRHYQYSGKTLGALLTNFIHDMPNSFSQAKALLSLAVSAIVDYPFSDNDHCVVRRDHREAVWIRDRPGSG
jgi:hypothetical protein